MGKGTIVNHISDGKYNITLDIDDSRAQQAITDLDAGILRYNTIITELGASRGTAWAMYDSARTKLNSIITQYMAGTATRKQVVAATVDMNSKLRLYHEYDRSYRAAELQQEALRKRKEYIEDKLAENPEPTIEAWCADLTENLSGNIGTIEIPNERTNDVQVRPGYDGEAVYNASRDGQLQQVVSSSAAGVYYNYAMFPGWQKWMPTYRVGKITAKPTQDTANVLLDSATSTAQNLDVNVSNTLSDVPIVYMDCDGAVFVVDDRVVVEFINQDHTNPRIIGFETNPKACELDLISIIYSGSGALTTIHDGVTGTVKSQCIPMGAGNKYNHWRGCTYDGLDFIAYNYTKKWVIKFNGIDTTICNIKDILNFSTYYTWFWNLAWDGTNLLVSHWIAGGFRFLRYNGFSTVLDTSFDLAGFTGYGMCWDFNTGDLIIGGTYPPDAPFTGKLIRLDGFSNVIKAKVNFPTTPDGLGFNTRACDGLTMWGTDLITWGGRSQLTPGIDEDVRIHDGFSSTIKFTDPFVITPRQMIDGIVYPKNG